MTGAGAIAGLLGLGGLGGLGLTAALSARRLTRGEGLVAFVAWGPIVLSLLSLALAEAGRFRPFPLFALSGAWALLGALAWLLARRRHGEEPDSASIPRWYPAAVALVLGAGLLLIHPAHRYLLGGWDPGDYVCSGAAMARTGSLAATDPVLPTLSRVEREALMYDRNPERPLLQAGYLIVDADQGRLMPDFYHLYPSWLAVWIRFLGLSGAWPGHTAVALLALFMAMAAAARLFGRPAAVLAGIALFLCPAQAYLMRFTTSEMLTQFCLFSGFWALTIALEGGGRGGLLLTAATAFGAAVVAHGTSVLPLAGVLAYLGARAVVRRDRGGWVAFGALAGAGALAMAWNGMRADLMTRYLWNTVAGHPERWIPAALAAAGCLAAGVAASRWSWANRPPWMRVLRILPAAAAGLLLLLGYFVRPWFPPAAEAHNVQFLLAVISAPAAGLAVGFLALKGWREWTAGQRAFLLAGVLAAIVLLANKMAVPVYFWAARRWVPVVIPLFLFSASSGAVALWRTGRPWARVLAAAAVAAWLGWMARPAARVFRVHEYEGMPALMGELAQLTGDADRVICGHWDPATPLRYAFGVPAWSLSHQPGPGGIRDAKAAAALMRRWVAEGRKVCWIGERFYDRELSLRPAGLAAGDFTALERRYDRLPRAAVQEVKRFLVYRVGPPAAVPEPGPVFLDVGYPAMGISGFGELERERDPATRSPVGYRRIRGTGRLAIPAKAGAWRIRLNGGEPARAEGWPVTLRAGGVEVASLTAGPVWETFLFSLPAGLGTNGVVELEIRSPAVRRGKRRLGVAVDWVASGHEKGAGDSREPSAPVNAPAPKSSN